MALVHDVEAATYFKFNVRYLHQLAAKRKLPAVKVGRKWMFDIADIEQFFKNKMIKDLTD